MPFVTRTYNPLHFEDLEPRRFEDLVRQLAYEFRLWRRLEATGRSGSDDGFDVRGMEIVAPDRPGSPLDDDDEQPDETASDRMWLIQCKRESSISPARLAAHLEAIPTSSTEALHGCLFVAPSNFSKRCRDLFLDWCRSRGVVDGHIWGRGELEDALFQPKNDGLLFAYFGFSLRIRQRSSRTDLRARLATKRKVTKLFAQPWSLILLRNPTDERYPFPSAEELAASGPRRWRLACLLGPHPKGFLVQSHRYLAYFDRETGGWDYLADTFMPGVQPYLDPWDPSDHHGANQGDPIGLDLWLGYDERNRADVLFSELITYDEIMDIDHDGDAAAAMPHVYVDTIKRREERILIRSHETPPFIDRVLDSARVDIMRKAFTERVAARDEQAQAGAEIGLGTGWPRGA